jgi:hypothetical protein
MLFLSLFLDLMMILGFGGLGRVDFAQIHDIHGHFPGPVDPHFEGLANHLHHGQHGHSVDPSGHEVFH